MARFKKIKCSANSDEKSMRNEKRIFDTKQFCVALGELARLIHAVSHQME